MSLTALALVLASAVVHATWNAILKRSKDVQGAIIGAMVVSGMFALGVGAALGFDFGHGHAMVWCLVSGLLEAAYFQSLGRALERGSLGVVYTISRGGSLLIVWPISILFLGEALTPMRAGGTALVLAGLAATGFGGARPTASEKRLADGVGYAILTGVFIGGFNLAYKAALAGGVAAGTANATSLGFAAIVNVAAVGAARRARAWKTLRAEPVALGVIGFLAATGFLFFLAALKFSGAGTVATLRNTSILFAQGFGILQGERPGRLAVLGTLAVTAGAVLLAL